MTIRRTGYFEGYLDDQIAEIITATNKDLENLKNYALKEGDSSQTFSVADATESSHAVNLGQLVNYSAHGTEFFTSSGSFTVPDNVETVYITMCGGGGGGGGGSTFSTGHAGGAGGNGQIVFKRAVSVMPGASIAVTIGRGGNGGASGELRGSTGSTGGTSNFGSYMSCVGGRGGDGGTTASTGANGTSYSVEGFFRQYGYRGIGGSDSGSAGNAGICIIEW